MFICGSGSFVNEEDEIYNILRTTPRRSRRSTSFCKILGKDNGNKNPFADRGLDKFNALLAQHDDKKQKIYTEMGSKDISFVRFVYTNGSEYAKPIVIRVKEKKKKQKMSILAKKSANSTMTRRESIDAVKDVTREQKEESSCNMKKCFTCTGSFRLHNLRQPLYLLPMIMVLILSCVAIFGRSFAIMCTTVVWYLISDVIGESSSSTSRIASSSKRSKPQIKKEYVKKMSLIKNVQNEGPS